jgi:hypothetical protein
MKRRAFSIAAVLSLVIGMHAPAQDQAAQDKGSEDPFDTSSFDQSVQQSTARESASGPEILVGGFFLSDNSFSTTTDLEGYTLGGSLSGKAFAKITVPDYGALYIGYNVSHNLYQGVGGTLPAAARPFLAAPAGDLFGASYALSELYYSYDIARTVFLRLGNQLIAWGPSFVWTPIDFINLQRANPLSAVDRRAGKPGLRVHVPLGPGNVFLFGDFSGTVTAAGVQDPLKTANLAARVDLTVLGFELALTGYWGQSIQNRYGFDFSGRVLGFDVYGEAAAAFPYDSYALTYAGSVGFQRTLDELGYWSIQGEFFHDEAGTEDSAAYPLLAAGGKFIPFYVGKNYAYAGISRSHIMVDGVSAALSGFANLSDLSWLARLSATIDLPELVPFTFSVRYAGGGAGKEFTWFTGDGSLSANLQIRFEF